LNVRVPVIHKQHKGYKDQISTEIHKVMDKSRVLSMVDGLLHPRKDLQCVKGTITIAPTKTKSQKHDIQDHKVGKLLYNNPEVNDLVGIRQRKK
jgi:hypothetical protein